MKNTVLTLGTAMLFTIGTIATTSFASPGHKQAEEKCGQSEHGESGHGGGHMGHMNDVLQILKRDLGNEYNHPVPPASKEQLAVGKKIFTKSCVACHGMSGKGDGPASAAFKQKPADFTDPEHSKFYSDQGRMHIIKKGITGTPMSGWEGTLNEKEIQSVHAYIRSLRMHEKNEKHGHDDHGEHSH